MKLILNQTSLLLLLVAVFPSLLLVKADLVKNGRVLKRPKGTSGESFHPIERAAEVTATTKNMTEVVSSVANNPSSTSTSVQVTADGTPMRSSPSSKSSSKYCEPLSLGNAALRPIAGQSSTEEPKNYFSASRAVDDIIPAADGDFSNPQFGISHTLSQQSPMWWVDLPYPTYIEEIIVYNRNSDQDSTLNDRIIGFRVEIRNHGVLTWDHQTNVNVPGKPVYNIKVDPDRCVIGNRVEIILPGNGKILHMREVQVIVTPHKKLV